MGRSAVTVATVSVGSASVQSPEPLGRHVRSAQPAQMLAARRGKGMLSTLAPGLSFTRQLSPAKTCANSHQNNSREMLGRVEGGDQGKKSKTVHKSKITDPF